MDSSQSSALKPIVLSSSTYKLLTRELTYAIDRVSSSEMKDWGRRVVKIFFWSGKRRIAGFSQFVRIIIRKSFSETNAIITAKNKRTHLVKKKDDLARGIADISERFVESGTGWYRAVRNNPTKVAPKFAGAMLGFLVGSGGLDGDGGIPDKDLLLGIGAHRSIFTHSILIGTFFETFIYGFVDLVGTVYGYLPEKHEEIWDTIMYQTESLLGGLSLGLSAGLAYHFAVDATFDAGGTYKDLPVELSIEYHRAIMATNAVMEGIDSTTRLIEHIKDGTTIGRSKHLVWRDEHLVFGFGKYRGTEVLTVAKSNPSYFRWIQSTNFPREVKSVAKGALLQLSPDKFYDRLRNWQSRVSST